MTILDRFKLEINKKEYFSDEEYTQFLSENNLKATDTFDKYKHYRRLLITVVDVLSMVANNIDLMRKISQDDTSIGQCMTQLETRIQAINKRLLTVQDEETENSNRMITPLFLD